MAFRQFFFDRLEMSKIVLPKVLFPFGHLHTIFELVKESPSTITQLIPDITFLGEFFIDTKGSPFRFLVGASVERADYSSDFYF